LGGERVNGALPGRRGSLRGARVAPSAQATRHPDEQPCAKQPSNNNFVIWPGCPLTPDPSPARGEGSIYGTAAKQRGSILKQRGSILKQRGSILKQRGSILKQRGSILAMRRHVRRLLERDFTRDASHYIDYRRVAARLRVAILALRLAAIQWRLTLPVFRT